MTITTRFTELVGCSVPIQQAGMGAASTPELAAAVSDAGGLGMLTSTAKDLSADVDATLAATGGRPFGVNFLMPFFARAMLEAVAHRVRLVEWFWGWPDPVLVAVAHKAGALASWQVGSRDEAAAAADAGCDLIVAQGVEAGGHIRGTLGLLPLLDAVLGAVEVPVIAAGGIGTGRGVAAVLAAGASAARIGTRFAATRESGAHPTYKQALVSAEAADTVVTQTFSVGWPGARHRVLRSAVQAAEALEAEQAGESGGGGRSSVIPRFAVQPPNRATQGHIDAMALYAGQSVTAVTAITPAADVLREIATDAEEFLRRTSAEFIVASGPLVPARNPPRTLTVCS
jgi:NAD(P)H-dependent flavin oxidoreductase YrpB (nitropropane dioxygenase family)